MRSLPALLPPTSPAAWGDQVVSFITLSSDDLFIHLLSFLGALPVLLTASSPGPGTVPDTQ